MIRRFAKRTITKLRDTDYVPLNWIVLSKTRLLANIQIFQQRDRSFSVIPVLKSNAYGHGIEQVATILNDANIDMVAVDGYFEAGRIRDITRHRILVMGYILPENAALLDIRRCSFVVQDVIGLQALATLQQPVKVHLELNTGMNRLGLQPDELAQYLDKLREYPQLELEGILTHLADADNAQDVTATNQQVKRFDMLVAEIIAAGFQPKLIHIAQTAGSVKVTSKYANALRIGIGTYGISSLQMTDKRAGELSQLKPVLELKSTVIKVLDLAKGDAVSYGGTFVAPKAMRIAVLPLGYYEGIPRALSNVGFVTFGKHRLPIVGRVCMNHSMVALGKTHLSVGDKVTVISANGKLPNSIQGMQRDHNLFAYDTLASLASPIRRIII